MNQIVNDNSTRSMTLIKYLTFFMFMMFAMTTDSVGVIIPEIMKQYNLSMTSAGMFHYGPMIAIALSGIFLGFLADKLGRKKAIIIGLTLFAANSYLFLLGSTFAFFLTLLTISGVAIGIFKTGALALIGDITKSPTEHTTTMNAVEGFFGIGAIIGPFIVAYLLKHGTDWKWLYIIAASLCIVLISIALLVKYPTSSKQNTESIDIKSTFSLVKNPFALGFSLAAFMYVAVECSIYVWMPTLIASYSGSAVFVATYALSIFFILRAGGRFLGAWILSKYDWSIVLAIFSFLIFVCFLGSVIGGVNYAVFLLPSSGLFMSLIYPTINSKGISCFPKNQHGSVAGIILFFTAAGAALGPLAIGAVSDFFNHNASAGFVLATLFAGCLFLGFLYNWKYKLTEINF